MKTTNPYTYLPLHGPRVSLTALEARDLPSLQQFFQDMAALEYYLPTTARPLNQRQLERLIDDWNDGLESFVFAVRQNQDLIGLVNLDGLDWPNSHAEVGIALTRDSARGQGLAAEAMQLLLQYAYEELGLHRVWARIIEDNQASIRLFEKLGFVREGSLTDHVFRRGRYRNMLIYGLLKPDSSCQSTG